MYGYVVRLPTKDPLLGVLRAPQSLAVEKNADYIKTCSAAVDVIPETV